MFKFNPFTGKLDQVTPELQWEAPVGVVDDSNVTFTVSVPPKYIVVNGSIYTEGDGIYTSFVSPTITLSSPVGVGGFIKSFY